MGLRMVAVCFMVAITPTASAQPVEAQEAAASLQGRARDAQGRGAGGIIVTALAPNLIRPFTTITSSTGDYVLPSLPPGSYVVAFTGDGYVPVKWTMRLSAAESATVHVVMHPDNGFGGAVTVSHERLVFPPSRTASFEPRALHHPLPLTGTFRSIVGLSTESPGGRLPQSLFVIDGMPLRHGWRAGDAAAFAGPGPESVRDLSLTLAPLPPDYGRLETGLIAVVTTPGTNRFSGSVRADIGSAGLNADLLRSSRPMTGSGATIEYTLGGPVRPDSTWFFASGRHLGDAFADDTAFTDVPFETTTRERLGIVRLTHAVSSKHRLEGQWVGAHQRLVNTPAFGAFRIADTRALDTRLLSDRALSAAYVGLLGQSVQLSARYTREDGTDGAPVTTRQESLVEQTRLIDQQTGVSAWASGRCAACEPLGLTHDTIRATAAIRLPGRMASHHITAGLDVARDAIDPTTQPVDGGFALHAARFEIAGQDIFPVVAPGGSSWIAWSPMADNRIKLRSDGFFVSDRWLAGDLLTVDLGVRFDRLRAETVAGGLPVLAEQGWSPRLAATWRPSAEHPWTVDAAYARNVSDGLDRAFASVALAPAQRIFVYDGPAINTAGAATPAADAIAQAFDWFFAAGGTSRPAWFASDPGVSTSAPRPIATPRLDEWSVGLSRLIGEDGWARVDMLGRDYGRFSVRRVEPGSAPAVDQFGLPIDVGQPVIDDRLERRYVGLSLSAAYRFSKLVNAGARYTVSYLRGNAYPAMPGDELPAGGILAYPEFTSAEWHLPLGALPDDARHRSRVWIHSELIASETQGTLMMSFLISTESGRPYGASGLVNVAPFVANPGYQQPPVAARYYFTARDAFRTPGMIRADLGLSYRRRMPGTVHGELFVNVDALNLGGQVEILNPERLTVVRTAFTDPSLQSFNPFTDTPVAGVHWTFDDANVRQGTARESLATTMGRGFRLAFGIRF